MKTSILRRTRGPKPITRFYTGFRRFGALVAFVAMLAATFYSASSASVSSKASRRLTNAASHSAAPSSSISSAGQKNVGTSLKDVMAEVERVNTSSLTASWFPQPVPAQSPFINPESISTYASDCETPQSSFVLGDTVCIRVVGAPISTEVQRRIAWSGPDGIILQGADITTDPQTGSYEIPNSATISSGELTLNTRGTWRVVTIAASDASVRSEAFFTVSDPQNASADLSLGIGQVGTSNAPAGGNVAFTLEVTNNGPDAATAVELRNPVPANTTFVSILQNSGPEFTCADPGEGNTGTTVCSGSSMAKDEKAIFTVIYKVAEGTPDETILATTASLTNAVSELRDIDNTMAGLATVGAAGCVVICPADITMGNDQDSYGAIVNYDAPTPTGSCGTEITSEPASGSFFPVGTTTVTASGANGSPCTFQVTINDTQAPVISCPADITTHESSSGSGSAVVNYAPPSVTENDPAGAPVTCDHASGDSFPVGATLVTCTATDAAGNTSEPCSFTVTVEGDATNCALTCPADITQEAEAGQCGAHVTYPDATASTECGTVSYSRPSGDLFPVGTTVVTVTTSAGRSCSFRVKVVDNQAPTVTPPANITANASSTSTTSCEVAINPGTATATDNCSGVTVTGTRDDGDPLNAAYPLGTTIITWTAKDASGNTKSADQTITVKDVTPPTVSVNAPPSVLNVDAEASCQVEIPDLSPYVTAADNCGANRLTITQSPAAGTIVGAGPHTITVTAIDGDPDNPPFNSASAPPVTFTVRDVTPPTIALDGANPLTVECHTSFTDPGATATDGCAGSFPATPSGSVDVNTPGEYTITYNATDPAGNAAQPVTRTVNVVDTTPPVIAVTGANPLTVECHTSYTELGATATDGCAGSFPATPSGTVDVNTPGSYTITYNATDPAGNAATPVTRTVNVVDTTPPVISCPANIVVVLPPNNTATSMPVSYPAVTATDSCAASVNVTSSPASGSVFPVGTTVVNATATDASGNTSSCSFTVTVLYNFTGFFQPVDNPPVLNMVNAGRAIPVKFSLSGNKGLSIFAPNSPASGVITCGTNAPVNEIEETVTAGSSSLSYDASSDQYIYVWKTNTAWAGTCRQLVVRLNDGSEHRANFKFR
jgi:uncharacterized repeat protein (TIGR01451 family)